jgi:hypothetical protein
MSERVEGERGGGAGEELQQGRRGKKTILINYNNFYYK